MSSNDINDITKDTTESIPAADVKVDSSQGNFTVSQNFEVK